MNSIVFVVVSRMAKIKGRSTMKGMKTGSGGMRGFNNANNCYCCCFGSFFIYFHKGIMLYKTDIQVSRLD